MPVSKKDAPDRRKSIAVTSLSKPVVVPKGRRRAHSIVPGDHLSPLAKLRRSLAPRKSILKAPINFNTDDAPIVSQSSSQPFPQSQNSALDESSTDYVVTDVTQEFRTRTHDNTSRKSLGRRVSFADHAHIRLFQKNKQSDTTSPHIQGSSTSKNPESHDSQLQAVTNENAYPSSMSRRRRSSVRQSMAGSQDMDLTAVVPSALSRPHDDDSALADWDDNDGYDDDMDVTDVINGDFLRKRSLSLGVRQPLSQIHNADHYSHNPDDTVSSTATDSQDMSDISGHTEVMDFTIPLNQSLRPPAHEDEVWLALRQATHSGNTSYELESPSDDERNRDGANMDLDDAMQRLMRGRVSLPLSEAQQLDNLDDSMSSNDNSFGDEGNENRTINLSKVGGRFSLDEPSIANTSLDYDESAMDESEVYGAIVPPVQSTPRHSLAKVDPPVELQITKASAIFQPPPSNSSSSNAHDGSAPPANNTDIPIPFSFTPQTSLPSRTSSVQASPLKPKGKPTFSAAFAPPVARPSPRKSMSSGAPQPTKRPRPLADDGNDGQNLNVDKPSPTKRQTLAEKWKESTTETPLVNHSVSPPSTKSPIPQLLSPSKMAPFQAARASATSRPPSALRRLSGYFARRKSLGVGLGNQAPTQKDPLSSIVSTSMNSVRISPKKKIGHGLGRASMGSAPSNAWNRPEGDVTSNALAKAPIVNAKRRESHTVDIISSPRRKSPSLTPAPAPPTDTRRSPSPAPSIQLVDQVDLSNILETRETGEDEPEVDVKVNSTEQWRDNVQQVNYEEDTPVISVEQFFSMTGIKFMDELSAPRRSMHQPSRQPRSPEDIKLAEYVNAIGIDIPQLVLYSRVSKDLQAWMEKSKEVFVQVEEEAAKVTPELFVEYSRADEEGQAELLHQLNLIRTNTRGLAKSDWYEWKLQWVEGLRTPADRSFNDLETDAKILESLRVAANELVPSLEKQYQELVTELEKERAEVAEIEASDQDYLNELKISIAEQNIEVEALQAEVAEGSDKLHWLEERFQEIEAQKLEAKTAIANAQRLLQIQSNSTRSEVFRLKDELEALEDLHMFHATKIDTHVFEYVYASQFCVHIPCRNFIPIVTKVDITRTDKHRTKYKDEFPRLSDWLLLTAKQLIADGDDASVRQIVHRLGDYWSSCTQLRSQLQLLSIKYPVNIYISTQKDNSMPSFVARAMVLFPSVKAKAFVSFTFTAEMVSQWPLSIGALECEVDVAYGPIDRSTILKVLMDRLSQASPSDNYACLLDACIEAQDIYV